MQRLVSSFVSATFFVAAAASAGCRGNSGEDGGADDETGGSPLTCEDCIDQDLLAFACGCDIDEDNLWCDDDAEQCGTICASNANLAYAACDADCSTLNQSQGGYAVGFAADACDGYDNVGTCSAWAPENEITLSAGVRYMEGSWLGSVVNDPSPLWSCDDAYFEPRRTTGFLVKQASSGELLYELGLRTNDRPLEINDMPLADWQDAFNAFFNLYLGGETEYHLEVSRSGSTVHLYYELVATFGP